MLCHFGMLMDQWHVCMIIIRNVLPLSSRDGHFTVHCGNYTVGGLIFIKMCI
jgi:hypothetical protein